MESKKMNLEDEQFAEIFKKEFKHDNNVISFKELYKNLEENKSPFISLNYSTLFSDFDMHVLIDKNYNFKIFYFAKKKYILTIKDSEGNEEKFDILSSFEITEIVKKRNIDIGNIYYNDEKFCETANYFTETQTNQIELYYDKDEFIELSKAKDQLIISTFTKIKPITLTKNYSLFFDDNPNEEISFLFTKERMLLFNGILKCFKYNNIFKFTGPSGIGKSFFLLYYSRMFSNIVYLNFGAIRNFENKKQYNKIKNLLAEEFKRTNFEENEVVSFNTILKDSWNIANIITNLINFCNKSQKNIQIILDQFKGDINLDNLKLEKVKLIACSSINDKKIRPSCISYFENMFDKKTINYNNYIYIEKLYEDKTKDNKILSYFGNIPKYVSRIKKCNTKDEYISQSETIKNNIIDKIKKFYSDKDFHQSIIELKIHLEKLIVISEFRTIIPLFPLKYFRISFYKEDNENLFFNDISNAKYFKLSYLFPFLSEIFEDWEYQLQNTFFKEGLFKKHTGSTIGGFFELVAIEAIKAQQKIKLPDYPIQNIIRVSKICDMDEIRPTLSENIIKMYDDKIQKMEIENDPVSKKAETNETQNMGEIFITLSENSKNLFKQKFIYSENPIIKIKEDYSKSFDKLILRDDDNKVLYYNNYFLTSKDKITTRFIKNKNYELKEQNILIKQEKENAEVYDLAYLYGPSNAKIFIGFQMKSYRDYQKNNRIFNIDKNKVIDKSKQLLLNAEYLLGVQITEWHFIIVGLYFGEENSKKFGDIKTYSENLIQFCEKKDLELILYNPINELFYSANKNEIEEFILSKKSKIGGENIKFYKFEEKNNFLGKKTALERCKESENMMNVVFQKKNSYIFFSTMETFITELKEKLNLQNIYFIGQKKYDESLNFFPIPDNNIILLFKRNVLTNEVNLTQFYAFIKYPNEKKAYVYDIKSGNRIDKEYEIQYLDLFNLSQPYYIFTFEELNNN